MMWIVFDYGNVLSLPQPESEAGEMARMVRADPAVFSRRYWEHRLDFDRATLTPEGYWSAVTGRQVTSAELDQLISMDVASWAHPDEGTLSFLRELLDQGGDVALLSNAPACVADGLDELPWIAAIDRRYYSGRMGMVKPDKEIFDHLAEELAADPAEIVFIDDRPENVEGARRAGMTGVHFTTADALRETLR
ncbi:HAD family phosphatase [Nonomuraea sp. NPDC005983]|uniref:HAD family hydrolase n=1 Tax=Nonomuraea sp. NPDC005983 TaxID=3155595 RepID=UPI0033B94481